MIYEMNLNCDNASVAENNRKVEEDLGLRGRSDKFPVPGTISLEEMLRGVYSRSSVDGCLTLKVNPCAPIH